MSLFKGKTTHIAVLQLDVIQDDIEMNLQTAERMIVTAVNNGANLICLPATFATGLNFPSLQRMAQQTGGKIGQFLQEQAKKHSVFICAGLLESCGKDIYDSALFIDDSGSQLCCYRRRCLWQEERDFICDGQSNGVIETTLGKIGLLVSYDVRFPEACRDYFRQDVDIIICVASLFTQFSFPIESICRARASDNGCCFVLASSLGSSRLAMMDYMGRSMIVNGLEEEIGKDPNIDILARAGVKESIIEAKIHPRKLSKTRRKQPYWVDYLRMNPSQAQT